MTMKEWTGHNTKDFRIMDRQQARDFDMWAIHKMGIPGVVLMENAAKNCTQVMIEFFPDPLRYGVCIFCGGGNNGGDGFVIARQLANCGVVVKVITCADLMKITSDAKTNYGICKKMNLPIQTLDVGALDLCRQVESAVEGSGLLVDALLGTGLQGPLKNQMELLISSVNSHNIPIIAVDIPSGLDCDSGRPLPVSVEADATVTFVALKKGFVDNPQSRQATGRVFVADIGITPNLLYSA